MKPSAAKKVFDILIGCFKYAKKQKLIYELPTDIRKLSSTKPTVKCWTKRELFFFLRFMRNTLLFRAVYIDVLIGLRVVELCGLRWCDIDLNTGELAFTPRLFQIELLKVYY